MKKIFVLILVLIVVFFVNASHSADWYVDTAGSDETGDGSQNNPFSTIQHAINQSSSEDTVKVAAGTYSEQVTMKSYVDLLGGYESTNWTRDIENNQTVIDGVGDYVVTKDEGQGRHTLDGFVIIASGRYGFKDVDGAVYDFIISNNKFIKTGVCSPDCRGIYLESPASATFQNNVIYDFGYGIMIRQPRHIDIMGNIIYTDTARTNSYGIMLYHELEPSSLIGNTIVRTSRGISLGSPINPVNHIIDRNIICMTEIGIVVGNEPVITCNNLWNNEVDFVACEPTSGNIYSNPLFCDSENADFSIAFSSPCAPENNECGVLIGALESTCENPYPIPTLSEWGSIIFITIMMGIGVVTLLKRRFDYIR